MIQAFVIFIALLLIPFSASAQYTKQAGKSVPIDEEAAAEKRTPKKSTDRVSETRKPVQRDKFGNAGGPQYDLAYDGAYEGETIVVVFLVPWGTFSDAEKALKKKGFGVVIFKDVPTAKQLKKSLEKANQFWLVSSCGSSNGKLKKDHVKVVRSFFDSGRGVFLWGDNDPCNDEANFLARPLFDIEVSGDLPGDQVVSFRTNKSKSGLLRDHLLSTGIEQLYEGVTVATVRANDLWTPFLWGSAGNIIAAFHDQKGKRALVDGGMTRLYNRWDTAGTGRFVVNAAAWLANY